MPDMGGQGLDSVERLLRILAVLESAGADGVRQERLIRQAGHGGAADARGALLRDIEELNRAGWEIVTSGSGGARRYTLTACGTRVPVRLSWEKETALSRASREQAAERDAGGSALAVGGDASMDACLRALGTRATLTFRYRGRIKHVHPSAVQAGPAGSWYLVARGDDGREGTFALGDVHEAVPGAPGSAAPVREARRGHPDPLSWLVDPPEEVQVRVAVPLAAEVEQSLGSAMRRAHTGDDLILTIPVTHQAAFRRRLYALGGRVEVLAPARVRADIVAELTRLAAKP